MSVSLTILDNGLRVATQSMQQVETVSLGVWVGSGARNEGEARHGISHMLEHMAFKGTTRRSAQAIAEEIESVGGELNAATSAETTAYYARVLKDDVPLALDLLADILLNATFDPTELAREQSVILQEIAAVQDCPEDVVFDLMQEAAYPGQAIGRPILGTPESVMRITPADLRAHLAEHYTAPNMVLAAAGAVDHDAFVSAAGSLFGDLPTTPAPPPQPAVYKGGIARSPRDFEQSHLVLAYLAPSYREEGGYYAAQVLASVLGGGMSSRLFQEAREKRGLCYAIYAFHSGYLDTGLFGVHTATSGDMLAELGELIARELQRLAETRPPEEEVARARAQIKAGLLMSLESSSARAQRMARQLLAVGRTVSTEELIDRIEAVTPEGVRALAQRILAGSSASLASLGDLGGVGSVDRLAAIFAPAAMRAAE